MLGASILLAQNLWITKEAAAAPCFVTTSLRKSRNDRETKSQKWILRIKARIVKKLAKDSRISKETSANAERCPLFCDEKLGFFKRVQGRILKRM